MTTDRVATNIATIDAEEALLGAILIESAYSNTREAIISASSILQYSDFLGYLPRERLVVQPQRSRIYYAMQQCKLSPHQINVAQIMNDLGILAKGDCSALVLLVANCPCSLGYSDYAKTVKHYSDLRNNKSISIHTPHKGLGF